MGHRIGSRGVLALMLSTAALAGGGCNGFVNMLAIPGLLTGPPEIPPQVKLLKDKRATAKAVVFTRANADLRWGNDSIDEDLTTMLIAEMVKEPRLKLVKDRELRQWKDKHARWETKPLQSVGEDFNVDYVIELEVTDFAVADPKSPYLYQGRANVAFKVHDVKKDQLVFTETYRREFPIGRPVPVGDVASEDSFRQAFLRVVAKELSWNVVARSTEEVNRDPY